MQKANVRNEEDRVKMEKERNNERVKSLESQLQRCMEETVCSSPLSCQLCIVAPVCPPAHPQPCACEWCACACGSMGWTIFKLGSNLGD
jgi:hypothetical protein